MATVYKWGAVNRREVPDEEIDTDNIVSVLEWCNHFSGANRISNDVALPLERCVVASYQVGYLFDYVKCKDGAVQRQYFEEGIASILIHLIASYEMTGRESIKTFPEVYKGTWDQFCKDSRIKTTNFGTKEDDFNFFLVNISENLFKYQRWMLYNHMERTKRWNEQEFNKVFQGVLEYCCALAHYMRCDLKEGFALAMSKIQDGEIKRH